MAQYQLSWGAIPLLSRYVGVLLCLKSSEILLMSDLGGIILVPIQTVQGEEAYTLTGVRLSYTCPRLQDDANL